MNLEFKISCKGLVITSVINDESLSLKLFVILSRDLQSITKRIEEDIKVMDLIQLNLQCLSYYTVKAISLYKKLETKYYLQVVVSRM